MPTVTTRVAQTFKKPNIAESYGTFASLSAAMTYVENADIKCAGLTVGIDQPDGSVKEWWLQPVEGELQFVEKGGGNTSNLATKQELQQGLSGKQDTISDLEQIRTRANEGHTALQPKQSGQYTENNFASFDSNGGIVDSGFSGDSFIKGVKQNGILIIPENGVVDVTVQDGASAYEIWLEENGYSSQDYSEEDFLNSLKARIGAFVYQDYDANTGVTNIGDVVVGSGSNGQINSLAPSQDTLDKIVLMPNNDSVLGSGNPTATMMFSTNEVAGTSPTHQFVYIGDVHVDASAFVLKSDIDNDFAGGSGKVASANEAKTLKREKLDKQNDDDTFYIVDSQDRIIAKIDASGVHSVDYTYKNTGDDDADENGNVSLKMKINTLLTLLGNETSAREGLAETVNTQLAEKLDAELDGNTFYFTDSNGYIICKIDAEGIHAPNIGGGGGNVSKEAVACMVIGESYFPTSITRNSTYGFVTTMNVIFQTGVTGSLTFTYDNTEGVTKGNITSIAVVYGTNNYTITISRDTDGNTTSISVA